MTQPEDRSPLPAREAAPGVWLRGEVEPLNHYKLALFDMDSTLIAIECIDEMASLAGKGAEVAAITEAAMRGEIADFRESLMRRLALLAGQPASLLSRVLRERLHYTPGAERLCAGLRAAGLQLGLVSGGFTVFSEPVARHLGLQMMRANVLEVEAGRLTGRVCAQDWGDVVDATAKRDFLLAQCAQLGIAPHQAIAVGDGANDLQMMGVAGLSVAYCAKPRVREQARVSIVEPGLDRLLALWA